MNANKWNELKTSLYDTVHPAKPVYRKVGWRNGKRVYEAVCYCRGKSSIRTKRVPYLKVQLKYSDPFKSRLARKYNRFWRVQRRWTIWFDRPKGFWRGLFGL